MGCSRSDNGCSDGDYSTCWVQIVSGAQKTYTKPMKFTGVTDKGSSVAICNDIDPEPLVLNGHNYLVKHERGVAVSRQNQMN